MSGPAQIIVEGVCHHYRPAVGREVLAVENVSLEVREREFLALLGQGHHLGLSRLGGGRCDLVAAGRIRVDRIDASVAADDAGQRHRHVSASRPDIGTPPALPQPQSVQGGGEGSPVHVVAKLQLDHAWHDRTPREAARPR